MLPFVISRCRVERALRRCSNKPVSHVTINGITICPNHRAHQRALRIKNGRWMRHLIMQVHGVGKISLISIVDVTSRLKAESYPSLETTNPALADYQLTLRRAFLTGRACRRP